jgi:hypothetical protein
MSSDYQPRQSGTSHRRGGRRRRGGFNNRRGNENRGPRQETAAKSSSNPIAKLIDWLFGKKPAKAASATKPRADFGDAKPPREERAKEPAVPTEVTSAKLYVGNLAYETGESDLFDLFSKVGAVKNVEIVMDRHSGRSKGFGFVEMESLERAKEAVEKNNRTDFMGRQIVVSGAKTK